MNDHGIPIERVINKLDEYLHKNDYAGALRHLLYWKEEAECTGDRRGQISINAELMGLYRKISKKDEAIAAAERAVALIEEAGLETSVTAGTIYVDAATVYNAFGEQEKSLVFFEKAKEAYEKLLPEGDARLAALYNNFALNLVALGRFEEAKALYDKALVIGEKIPHGGADMAITYLNLANYYEAKLGLEDALDDIESCLISAQTLLDAVENKDGYYAFVCEKCANTFGYYGYVEYAEKLKAVSKEIYERSGT